MSGVIEFPKYKSRRVTTEQKINAQKAFLTLSVFVFIMVAVMSNEQVTKTQRPVYLISDNSNVNLANLNRAIASAQPVNMFRDIQWEHDLAKRLAAESGLERTPAAIQSGDPSDMDQFRFGLLAGKYRIKAKPDVKQSSHQIQEIEYIDSVEISDRPVQIDDRKSFLHEHRSLMAVAFDSASLKSQAGGQETWILKSASGQTVGEAHVFMNEDNRFMGLKVQSAESLGRVSAE